jgi:hypothetical protein
MKKKLTGLLLLLSVLAMTGCLLTTSMNVTVRETPPVVVVSDDPELVVIPGTYVYWLDARDGDVYFYGGVWWRFWGQSWYRAETYSGSWVVIRVAEVPHPVAYLSSDWKQRRNEAPRVRWGETRSQWKGWENDRHWEKRKWKRDEPGRR